MENKRIVSGSSFGIIMGLNPYKSRINYYRECIGETDDSFVENEKMYWGREFEPLVRKRMEADLGKIKEFGDYENPGAVRINHPTLKGVSVLLDGWAIGSNAKPIVEIKCVGMDKSRDWSNDSVPPYYYAQVQGQMWVTEAYINKHKTIEFLNREIIEVNNFAGKFEGAYFGVLVGGQEFRLIYIKRDSDFIERLETDTRYFLNCVKSKTVPEKQGTDKPEDYYKQPNNTAGIDNCPFTGELLAELFNMNTQLKPLKKRKDELEKEIKDAIGFSVGISGGGYTATWKSPIIKTVDVDYLPKELVNRYMRFNQSAFRKSCPDEFNKYSKEITGSRRFSLKKDK
tara:strand:+ start:1528 stop:2553 length:1026 start_codon:yes stop_codon:yes gene_type:complete